MQTLARPLRLASLAVLLALAPACLGQRLVHPIMPTGDELSEFQAAGPVRIETHAEGIVAFQITGGEYHVVSGDLLSIELPRELISSDAEDAESIEVIRSRVNAEGTIRLPSVDEIEVGGRTPSEIEATLVALYHPTYIDTKPNIVVTVAEHRTEPVAVVGSVASPGIHHLRSDRMSLLGALMAAGGIDQERGAGSIRIVQPDGSEEPIVLPVHNSSIPFGDVTLRGGETIVVDALPEQSFSCTGLVRRPGSFPYPSSQNYNLMQALAVAGGLDQFAAPRYATIYRRTSKGEVIAATFRLDGTALTDASNIFVKPGDVVSVDHTLGSWTRQFLSQVLGFRASFSATSADSF